MTEPSGRWCRFVAYWRSVVKARQGSSRLVKARRDSRPGWANPISSPSVFRVANRGGGESVVDYEPQQRIDSDLRGGELN
jgi:hypothetical protein